MFPLQNFTNMLRAQELISIFFFAGCSEMNWRGQECLTLIKRLGEDFRIGSETMSVQFT
jgi:hypothetical protein